MSDIKIKKLAIGFITYNDFTSNYLRYFLLSLYAQSFSDFDIFVADNSERADNKNAEYIKNNFPDINYKWMEENAGFGRAYNYIIERVRVKSYEYFMIVNPDMIMEPDALSKLMEKIELENDLGSVCPKILNWNFEKNEKTDKIDSLGLKMSKPLRFIDLGQGEIDQGQFDNMEIMGPSGAAGIYRMSALEKIKDEHGYFDERMFMYKEDCDLAYRLSVNGFKSRCVSDSLFYHDRTVSSHGNSIWKIMFNRKNKNLNVKKWSFLNQQIIFCKHWGNLNLFEKISVLIYQLKVLIYVIIFERYLLKELLGLRKIIKSPKI